MKYSHEKPKYLHNVFLLMMHGDLFNHKLHPRDDDQLCGNMEGTRK